MIYLASAFIIVWLLVGLYVIQIGRRQNNIAAELEALQEMRNEK
ncbi:MAG: CcmD family protein [Caldilineaceae bacterium]|nr:CcmD family protein [Caldilineaceae bacterium]